MPGLCDVVADYAKCWVADVPHGTTFLIIGNRNAGKMTLLRDVLQRRSCYYQYGEIVTRLDLGWDMSLSGSIQAKQDIESIDAFLSKAQRNVWIGSALLSRELRSNHLSTLVKHARHFKTDVILSAQYTLNISAALRPNVDIVFAFADQSQANRERLYDNFFKDYYEDFSAFKDDFEAATKDFGCLCADRLKSEVVHFKADLNLQAVLGSKEITSISLHGRPNDSKIFDLISDTFLQPATVKGKMLSVLLQTLRFFLRQHSAKKIVFF